LPGAVMIQPGLALRPFTTDGWLRGLEKQVEILPWPAGVEGAPVEFEETATGAVAVAGETAPRALLPREASRLVLETAGVEITNGRGRPTAATGAPLPAVVDAASPFFAQK